MTNEHPQAVTIVSGLPRSGTSMMMQMLAAGGLPALNDGVRKPDEDNPHGYYEFEAVKRTRQDPSWLEQAGGHVVKMVYRLLYDLPTGYRYQVVLMRRNLEEVLASQKVMLQRHSNAPEGPRDEELAKLFGRELDRLRRWLQDQPHFAVCEVDYNRLLQDPPTAIAEINRFLGGRLDPMAMQRSIDPSLYRNRRLPAAAPAANLGS